VIRNEIKILRSLEYNDEILQLLYIYESPKQICLVFENFEGDSLYKMLDDLGRLSEDECREIMRRLMTVLNFLHARKIIHRDLKPASIYLNKRNRIKVTDFGFATVLGAKDIKQKCGFPGFIAPEVLRGEMYDMKVDIFSAGAILYNWYLNDFKNLQLV